MQIDNLTIQILSAFSELKQQHDRPPSADSDLYERWLEVSRLDVQIVGLVGAFSPDPQQASVIRQISQTGFFHQGGMLVGDLAFNHLPLEMGKYSHKAPIEQKAPVQVSSVHPEHFECLRANNINVDIVKPDEIISDYSWMTVSPYDEGIPIRLPAPENYALWALSKGDDKSLKQARWLFEALGEFREIELWFSWGKFFRDRPDADKLLDNLAIAKHRIEEVQETFGAFSSENINELAETFDRPQMTRPLADNGEPQGW